MPKTVLIIEDSATMRRLIQMVLAKEDLSFVEADTATDGINAAINVEPDLIIADELMEGKTAVEICRLLKQEYALDFIPFLVLSGQFHRFDHAAASLAGVDDAMPKPFEADDFLRKVLDLLDIFADRRPANRTGRPMDESGASYPLADEVVGIEDKTDPDSRPLSYMSRPAGASDRAGVGFDAPQVPGLTQSIHDDLRSGEPTVAGYDDPIATFFHEGGSDPDASAGGDASPVFRNPPESGMPVPPDPEPLIRVSTPETAERPSEKAAAPATPSAISPSSPLAKVSGLNSMASRGINLADEELEQLVSVEIRRRLAKIRLQDLDAEIKSIMQKAVDKTLQEMLPQIKTEIILSVVKMLKDK